MFNRQLNSSHCQWQESTDHDCGAEPKAVQGIVNEGKSTTENQCQSLKEGYDTLAVWNFIHKTAMFI
jgi:hypothetical protein